MRILVAGFGNVLRSDDGFGVAVVAHLAGSSVPTDVELMDVGIGGIHLVQMLNDPVDVLIVVDAIDLDRPPGTVVVMDPEIEDVSLLTDTERRDRLADMHYATPERALMLARALEVLPPTTVVVGCVPVDADTPDTRMSHVVTHAVPVAAAEVRRLVTEVGVPWPT